MKTFIALIVLIAAAIIWQVCKKKTEAVIVEDPSELSGEKDENNKDLD